MIARPVSLLLTVSLFSCDKTDEEPAAKPAKAEEKKDDADEKKAEPAGKDDSKSAAAEGGDAPEKSAAGDEPANPDAVTECPKSLSGRENVDRVITKACGTVPVTGSYSIEGATLTLEAGATLAFKDGAELAVGYYEPAKLIVKGTKDAAVTFTSGGDKAAGVWKGLRLYEKSSRSKIEGLVVEYAGDKKGAVAIQGEDITVSGSTIRHVKEVGLDATKKASFAEFSNNTFEDVGAVAMRLPPNLVGGIGEGNTFDAKSRVHVRAGTVDADTTWNALSVPYLVVGQVRVDGKEGTRAKLTLAAGTVLEFDGDAMLGIGYYAEGSLIATGEAGKPVTFRGNDRKEAGGWRGLAIYGKGEAELQHATLEHGGKREAEGVLLADNRSRVTVKDSTFNANASGIVLRGANVEAVAIDGNSFKATPVAIRLPAHQVGALGAGNSYEGEAAVEIIGSKTGKDATWAPQKGAKVKLEGNLGVDGGTLELKPGYELWIKDGVGIDVGYYDTAALKLMGTSSAPIRLVGQRDDTGTWKSLVFHKNAHGNELHHVSVVGAGGDAGVQFKSGSDGKIDTLSCDKCKGAALDRHEKSEVEAANVK